MLWARGFVPKFISAKPAMTPVQHKSCLWGLEVLKSPKRTQLVCPAKEIGRWLLLKESIFPEDKMQQQLTDFTEVQDQ